MTADGTDDDKIKPQGLNDSQSAPSYVAFGTSEC